MNPCDLSMIKQLLEDHIKETADLLHQISNSGGRLLTTDEKSLIREVLAGGWFRDMASEMRFHFFEGRKEGVERTSTHVLDTLSQLQ